MASAMTASPMTSLLTAPNRLEREYSATLCSRVSYFDIQTTYIHRNISVPIVVGSSRSIGKLTTKTPPEGGAVVTSFARVFRSHP
jgi:hypothetical protein